METFFGKNIKHLRKLSGKNRDEMALELGFTSSTLGNYEANYSKPKFDDLLKMCQIFGISETELIHSDLSNAHLNEKTREKKNGINAHLNAHATAHLIQESGVKKGSLEALGVQKENVFDFESAAAAGSAMLLLQEDKSRAVPNLYLPELGSGIHIRIPISGDSMHSTIKDGDKAVATQVLELQDIRQGYIYIILDKDEGVVCKRLYLDGKHGIELVSDNEIYKPYKRHLKDVLAIFRVSQVHTHDLRPYWNDLRTEMREIRSEMADFRRLLKRK